MRRPISLLIILGVICLTALTITTLSWNSAAAQSGNQWRVDYYANTNWSGSPVYTEFSNLINFNWNQTPPGPGVPAENFTARMTTSAFFYGGVYRFTLLADDEVALIVNNQTFFSTIGAPQPGKTFVVDVPMTQGTSTIQLDFRQYTGSGYISAYWDYTKGGPTPTPPPPSGSSSPWSDPSVVTDYGDYTRCIQQDLHQSECFQATGAWNSPNLGSIQMEPQIVLWQPCKADENKTQQLYPDEDAQGTKCSKTEAGWFPT